jgi:hypothetical protein
MMLSSNYFKWQFHAILVTLYFQTLLQPAHGNSDTIYKEMHEKLFFFEKLAQPIVEEGTMDSDIKHELAQREKNIKKAISMNDEISKMLKTWKSEGIESLDDYLTLKRKVQQSLLEKIFEKSKQIKIPLNLQKQYRNVQQEKMEKTRNIYYNLLGFLEVTKAKNEAFFKLLTPRCRDYINADDEVILNLPLNSKFLEGVSCEQKIYIDLTLF